MLPPGMASMYSPSSSFQSLLANMTAVPHGRAPPLPPSLAAKPPMLVGSPDLHSPNNHQQLLASPPNSPGLQQPPLPPAQLSPQQLVGISLTHQAPPPPGSPTIQTAPVALTLTHSHSHPPHPHAPHAHSPQRQLAPPPPPARAATPPEDRRTSSIAALRLKAREHELKLELLRQNGHSGDLVS